MADTTVKLTIPYYPNPASSRSLSGAQIYVGDVDTDPEIVGNQKTLSVLLENGSTVTISQPATTNAGGQVVYNGSPVTLLCTGAYSLKVLDSAGTQQYYIPNCPSDVRPDSLDVGDLTVTANNVLLGNDDGASQPGQELTASEAKAILSIVPADTTITANNVLLGNDNGATQAAQELTASEAKTLLAIVAADVSDFDTEVSNNVNVAANTTHKTSDGSDHTFIDQSVISGSSPTLDATNITGSPTFTTLGATTVNATTINGTTFDTNVAAAGLTLAGTTLAADGTDTHIDITVTPKGNAGIVIPNLGAPPAVTTNKFYQVGGVAYFDGNSLEGGGASASDVAYTRAGWNGDTTDAATKNVLSDAFYNMVRWQDADTGGSDSLFLGPIGNTTNTGGNNLFAGVGAGGANTSGGTNIFLGTNAGRSNLTANSCIAIGVGSLYTMATAGNNNIAIGREALFNLNNASAVYNCVVGNYSGDAMTEGAGNSLYGYGSGGAITTGVGNFCGGFQAGDNITTGGKNVVIGYDVNVASATSSSQLAIGDGTNTSISGNFGSFIDINEHLRFGGGIGNSVSLSTNGMISLQSPDNTTVRVLLRGSDGTTRTYDITVS